ncbi:NB-ARC domain-containing protein, partial [bacterium]|nr:NB-ARC domain-containing protein [bacterium]
MDKTIKILILAANPKDTNQLRLDQEMRGIDQALRQTDFRDKFDIKQHWAVRVVDLQGYLLRHKPDIVHFSGHGSASSEILLEDINGNSQPVSVRALSQLFSVLKDNIRCVILNACYSENQAQAIAQHIDCVIGMSKAIGDSAAISFAVAFYQALGYGRDVKTAFDLGCLQIDLESLDEQNAPKLIAINCNPQKIVFVQTKGDDEKKIDHLTRKEVIKRKISHKNEKSPLKTPSGRPKNLPAQITPLIGRESESEALRQLLLKAEVRLVTLTGPGGIGKTSLSLQVATSLLDEFNNGIFFVSLAAISDPKLVLPTIAQTLGIRESRSKPLRESVIEYLRDKHLLFVLDNFEQLVAAAPAVSDLLAACQHLKILVTSRIVLRLKGECEYPVEPLPAPDPHAAISKD